MLLCRSGGWSVNRCVCGRRNGWKGSFLYRLSYASSLSIHKKSLMTAYYWEGWIIGTHKYAIYILVSSIKLKHACFRCAELMNCSLSLSLSHPSLLIAACYTEMFTTYAKFVTASKIAILCIG